MSKIAMIATVGLLLTCPSVAFPQISIDGTEYKDASTVLRDIGATSLVYRPSDPNSKQLYYVPFFVFKADKEGKLEVAVLNSPDPKMKQIAIWLLISPQNKVDA